MVPVKMASSKHPRVFRVLVPRAEKSAAQSQPLPTSNKKASSRTLNVTVHSEIFVTGTVENQTSSRTNSRAITARLSLSGSLTFRCPCASRYASNITSEVVKVGSKPNKIQDSRGADDDDDDDDCDR